MRELLDAILAFIGAESFTDEEFDALLIENTSDQIANYGALLRLLNSRESLSSMKDRLLFYYKAKGVAVPEPDVAKSNVLMGGAL